MSIFTRVRIFLTIAEISKKIIYASEVSFQKSVAGISLEMKQARKRGRTIRAKQTDFRTDVVKSYSNDGRKSYPRSFLNQGSREGNFS
jgi:hypothetical protein